MKYYVALSITDFRNFTRRQSQSFICSVSLGLIRISRLYTTVSYQVQYRIREIGICNFCGRWDNEIFRQDSWKIRAISKRGSARARASVTDLWLRPFAPGWAVPCRSRCSLAAVRSVRSCGHVDRSLPCNERNTVPPSTSVSPWARALKRADPGQKRRNPSRLGRRSGF